MDNFYDNNQFDIRYVNLWLFIYTTVERECLNHREHFHRNVG